MEDVSEGSQNIPGLAEDGDGGDYQGLVAVRNE